MAKEPKPDGDEGSGDGGDLKITDKYLLDFAEKKIAPYQALLEGDHSLFMLKNKWQNGSLIGDEGKLLPGNTVRLPSAEQLQTNFQAYAKQLVSAFAIISAAAHGSYVTLHDIRLLLQNADDEALSAAEMWEVLTQVQQHSKPPTSGNPPAGNQS
ncbi:hypothetical protein J7F03_16335 [Streptomyces sp. ISL-43]|uniref:hypothetical protein n=1 Tax=Streptomyces sp. ISL-43 TaxID=2819183 RepID=UPI001BECEBEB|nr:hypothetical protein [Streptomyces sp. ISL-43]MBT2448630.1 hypothetical protein [Streptomyces sp. ISL-43]